MHKFASFTILIFILGKSESANVSLSRHGVQVKPEIGIKGVVTTVRCGGVGTPLQLRIDGCEGYCQFRAGQVYECEEDFMPSSAAPSLTLGVEICYRGVCYVILTAVIPNSSIQPGFRYTAKYSIVPNDVFAGQTIRFFASIWHTDNGIVEVCVAADADILPL